MTTRKKISARFVALVAFTVTLAGCATPGPLHIYSLASTTAQEIRDDGPAQATNVPSFLAAGETLTGFTYDPFTDHFFLRLAPGNRIRVVDRPARVVKREFTAESTPATGGGDLAVRQRDGHLFLTHPSEPVLVELNRFGKFVRTVALAGLNKAPAGVAYDAVRDRLLVLTGGPETRVIAFDLDGQVVATIALERAVAAGALGYDADQREIYAPLASANGIGVFGDDGRLLRTLAPVAAFLDVGTRSLLRMF